VHVGPEFQATLSLMQFVLQAQCNHGSIHTRIIPSEVNAITYSYLASDNL